jgi:hypothetical protein
VFLISNFRPWPPCGLLHSTACFCSWTRPHPVTLRPNGSGYFEPHLFPYEYPNISQTWSFLHLPAYEDGTVCSETSAYKIQTPGNYPEESIQQIICTNNVNTSTSSTTNFNCNQMLLLGYMFRPRAKIIFRPYTSES